VLAKKWLFWFCEAWASCVGVKPNVPLVRLVIIVFKKCGSAKKIKHEALGCCVGKKSAVKFICRPVVSIIFCSLMVVVSSVTLAYNSLVTLPKVMNTSYYVCVTLPFVQVYFLTKIIFITNPQKAILFFANFCRSSRPKKIQSPA